jgi:hypothetical protein
MTSVAARRFARSKPVLIATTLALALVSLSHPVRAHAVGERTFAEG